MIKRYFKAITVRSHAESLSASKYPVKPVAKIASVDCSLALFSSTLDIQKRSCLDDGHGALL